MCSDNGNSLFGGCGGPEKGRLACVCNAHVNFYLELVYLVTALVPSLTACLASSPGSSRRTAV